MVLKINSNLTNGQFVEKGDTIGVIYSSSQQKNLVELNGELDVLTASLEVSISGEKKTEVIESELRLEMAKSEYAKQSKILERLNKQLNKEIIAEEVYETASDELIILENAVKVCQAELESSISGEKEETINMLKKQIIATKNKISFLLNEIDSKNSIVVPFMGRIERSFSEDTLIVISNIESGIALIPIDLEEAKYIELNAKVSFSSTNSSELLTGVVCTKHPVMQIIGGKQCVLVLANIQNISSDFISGMITQAEINCSDVNLQTYLKRNIKM
jgi:ribosome-binding ATPase YchF (GTP1/OBG family)